MPSFVSEGSRAATSPLRSWLPFAASALAILVGIGLAHREPASVAWYAGQVLVGLAMGVMVATPAGRRVGWVALGVYLPVLVGLTVLAGVGLIDDPAAEGARVTLLSGHPNVLAASLVVMTATGLAARQSGRWAALAPLVAVAVLFTGSRAGLAALAIAMAVWALRPGVGPRRRFAMLAAMAAVATIASAAVVLADREDASPNLLRTTVDLTGTRWTPGPGVTVEARPRAIAAPLEGARAPFLVTPSVDAPSLLRQDGIGRSQAGAPYVASVYLRAETPTRVFLGNNLASRTCDVGPEWTRCTTPAGVGNGTTYVQFRLELRAPAPAVPVWVFGPQIERAAEPGPYAPKGAAPIPEALLERLSPAAIAGGDPHRAAVWRLAFDAFRAAPWIGIGRDGILGLLRGAPAELGVGHLAHTHNLLLERLLAEGMLGTLAWALLLAPAIVGAWRRRRWAIAPLLAALAVLNMPDRTFFELGSLLPVWFALTWSWTAPLQEPARAAPRTPPG